MLKVSFLPSGLTSKVKQFYNCVPHSTVLTVSFHLRGLSWECAAWWLLKAGQIPCTVDLVFFHSPLERWEAVKLWMRAGRTIQPGTFLLSQTLFQIVMCPAPNSCVVSAEVLFLCSWNAGARTFLHFGILLSSTDSSSLSKEPKDLIWILVCGCQILEQEPAVAGVNSHLPCFLFPDGREGE